MAFEYPAGHVLARPSARPSRTPRFGAGAEPPAPLPGLYAGLRTQPGTAGTGLGAGAGVIGFEPQITPQPAFPPLIPLAAGALAVGGLIADVLTPGAGLIQQDLGGYPGGAYGVPFGGPGLKEPGGKYLLKEWHIRMDSKEGDFDLQFYLTQNDRGTKRVFMYNQRTKAWKSWPMPRLAVIGKNLPSHQMITRLRRNLKRHTADAVTILKLTAPGKLESTRRAGGRYVKGRKRWVD